MLVSSAYGTLISILLLLIRVAVAQSVALNWENVAYLKTVDVSRSIIHEAAQIRIRNVGEEANDVYLVAFSSDVASSLSMFSSMLKGKEVYVDCALTGRGTKLPTGEQVVYGSIKLPLKIAPQEEIELVIHYSHNANHYPYPQYIEMDSVQTLIVEAETQPLSPYSTTSYSLNIIGSDSIKKFGEKDSVSSNSFTLDGVSDIEPFTVSKAKFLYIRNLPLPRVAHLNREAWVSHWSSTLEFKEYYELINDAAKLSSGFSRADYMKNKLGMKPSSALIALDMILPEDSYSHHYTDLVGMVSTSKAHENHYFIKPRFPLFGGWKFNFTIGWTNSLSQFLHAVSEDEFILALPLLNGPQDVFYDTANISIFLPEGAIVQDLQTPLAFVSTETTYQHSYFDLGSGHVKVTISMKNLNDDLREGNIFLSYKYSKLEMFRKPLSIALYVFIALFSLFLLKQIQLNIST